MTLCQAWRDFLSFISCSLIEMIHAWSMIKELIVNSFIPGCLKCECESREDFPTATVVSEFVEYAGNRKKKKILNQKFYMEFAQKEQKKWAKTKWLKNHSSLDRLKGEKGCKNI